MSRPEAATGCPRPPPIDYHYYGLQIAVGATYTADHAGDRRNLSSRGGDLINRRQCDMHCVRICSRKQTPIVRR